MEWLKDDLKYTEIGGVYVNKRRNCGWKLVTDDAGVNECTEKSKNSLVEFFIDCDGDKEIASVKQMQPHLSLLKISMMRGNEG